jgi:DNA-binding CsgD family transcriptional regulator
MRPESSPMGLSTVHRVHLEQCLHEIPQLGDQAEADAFLRNAMDKFELGYCVYHARALPGSPDQNPVVITTYPTAWVDHYIQRDYVSIDPVVHDAERSIIPLDWATLDRKPVIVKRLFGEAGEFGVGGQGLTFCIRGPNNDRALFSINSRLNDHDWSRMKPELMAEMQIFAQFFHTQLVKLKGGIPAMADLSRREAECLGLTGRGLTVKEIARQLHVSPPAVRAYVDSARHKLGALNKTHATAIATRNGII